MLTIDDVNSIIERYGDIGFWYTLDLTKCSQTVDSITNYDFMEIKTNGSGSYYIKMNNTLFHGLHYCTRNGGIISTKLSKLPDGSEYDYATPYTTSVPDAIHLFLTVDDSIDLEYNFNQVAPLILPKGSLQIPVINGKFDDKFYFTIARSGIAAYTIDDVEVEPETDEQGTFLRLPSAEDCIIGVKSSTTSFPLYKVTFKEFKSLPTLRLLPVYKGTPNELVLVESDTYTTVPEFEAFYQGRKLENNIINLPYDAPDVVDVVINIKDRRFPPVRLKLKVKTRVYTATNLSQLNTALEQGIRTLKLTLSLSNPVSDKVLEDMIFIDSNNVVFEGCTLNNVSFIQITNRGRSGGQIIDGGENTFNNCIVDTNVWTVYDLQSKYAEMEFKNTRIVGRNCPLYLTNGTFNGCEVNQCTLISDGNVTITNNTFNSTPSSSYPVKDYFPSSLYLTGEYTVKGNLFKLNDEWESPAFNMCIIKTVDGFNPSQFINDNSFDLNIIYDDEPTDTFYYNIVDDDKIYARRVS